MFVKEIEQELYIPNNIFSSYAMHDIVYFDIETTGFDKEEDKIILVSLGAYKTKSKFVVKQYYAEELDDEIKLLYAFSKDIEGYEKWCSYNGIAFDEPFVEKRMIKNDVSFMFPEKHIDLYRIIRPYYKQLGMERCNLKTVEKYIGINRKDRINGGESVKLYYEYLKNKDIRLRDTIMLHNYEDVLNLPKIFKLVYKIEQDSSLIPMNAITDKQLNYLTFLLTKNNINLNKDIEKISKKAASRIINNILKGNKDVEKLNKIINNSY
ncbi:putative 3'-5' exonuclease [Clostridium acetireducens DSM 10703]|uniref:Putative 3'-5' exonuclease n=1 Tax=Clostridium acetireducens DSM 10703 TaxID=1121290 RepID=A0A1E8F0K8_9CLOT|nr:ribonuclease H-like domain-containing protein [Clostridium acetireducens]OFI06950.1 putative 3'-5' exonuclease [Clostridium acetireducens DSM 10703]